MKYRSICFINPTVLIKRPIADLINELKDYDIGLLCPKKLFKKVNNNLHYSKLIRKSKVYTYSTITLPFISSEWPIPITPVFFIQLFRVFLNYKIIHMWTHFYLSNFFVFLIKIIFPRVKLILTMDTIPGYSFSMGKIMDLLFKIYYFLFWWIIFKVPNKVTLYGKSLVKYAIKVGVPKRKIKVIPTGINIDEFKITQKNIKKEFGINKKTRIVLFVGLLIPRKGIDIIIKTANILKQKDIIFLLVGGGPDKKRYQDMVAKYHLKKKVIFTGWRKDIKRFYKSADIFFLPSKGEGLAGVIMEAMASGVPIVSSNIPCTPDLIENEKNGFLCEKENILCYVENIKTLIEDEKLRQKMRLEGLERIKRFRWNKILRKYHNIYE